MHFGICFVISRPRHIRCFGPHRRAVAASLLGLAAACAPLPRVDSMIVEAEGGMPLASATGGSVTEHRVLTVGATGTVEAERTDALGQSPRADTQRRMTLQQQTVDALLQAATEADVFAAPADSTLTCTDAQDLTVTVTSGRRRKVARTNHCARGTQEMTRLLTMALAVMHTLRIACH